jgi:hypothetical protein
MDISILGKQVRSPLRFEIDLEFPKEDIENFPWLADHPRYYSLDEQLDPGGFALPFRGYPCDKAGNKRNGSPTVVIKIPYLEKPGRFTTDEVDQRRRYIEDHIREEWAIVRTKLRTCKHANPIFDFGTLWIDTIPLYVTAQLFLHDARPLNDWLFMKHHRPKVEWNENDEEIDNWRGIPKSEDWTSIAMMIAEGLTAIHAHRIVHADIWPPNIFISDGAEPYAKFIDFGESFLLTPSDAPHTQLNHAYRAPERRGLEYLTTEQIDVYSFGKLLFYLAIGKPVIIDNSRYGHARRDWIRSQILGRNPELARQNPSIVDIITHCTAIDPVDRPTMREVYEDLSENCADNRSSMTSRHHLKERLQSMTAAVESGFGERGSIFLYFVNRKLADVEQLITTHQPEMIRIGGTRDELLRTLLALFNELGPGDAWTSLTSPGVWQGSALGCDGRYATATIKAVRRGASVHRTYMVSIEELGLDWADKFTGKLEGIEECGALARCFRKAIREFQLRPPDQPGHVSRRPFLNDHQTCFVRVTESLRIMLQTWNLDKRLFSGAHNGIKKTEGLYIGLLPVATLSDSQKLRTKNPVSLMYVNRETEEHDKWLMVMTDLRGRNENEPGALSKPELRGVRIYKSVKNIPHDRIIRLERLMKDSCNVGPIIEKVAHCSVGVPPIGTH